MHLIGIFHRIFTTHAAKITTPTDKLFIYNQVTVSAPRSNDVNKNVYLLHNIFVTYKR